MKKISLSILTLLISLTSAFGSHIPGGNLTWQCTGNPNEYIVTMVMFVSCPSTLGNSYTGSVSNTCGLPNPVLVMPQVGMMQEVSQICPTSLWNSACATPAGTIPGVRKYTYQTTVTLPGPCNTWDFAFSLCCRDNSTNTNGGSGNSMYFHSGMNSTTAPCDNSPYVTAQPIPYVCAGVNQSYCPGAIDPDGDSLYYSLVNPLGANAVPITHPAPYSPTQPLQNLVFDPLTGCLTFNQPTIGNFVVTYLIQAYDANGNLTGFIYHDFQFEVIISSNCQPPVGPAAGLTNLTPSATLLNPNTIEACEGSNFCFDVTFTDPDIGDTLKLDSLSTTLYTVLPGATVTPSGTNPLTFTVCWTVPFGASSTTSFTIGVSDGACPIENKAVYPIQIKVKYQCGLCFPPIPIATSPTCKDSSNGKIIATPVFVSGSEIQSFTWTDSITSAILKTTNNITTGMQDSLIGLPAGTYIITMVDTSGCASQVSVRLNEPDSVKITSLTSDKFICINGNTQINASTIGGNGAPYNFNWIDLSTSLPIAGNGPHTVSPIISPTCYSVFATDPKGCTSITEQVCISLYPNLNATTLNNSITICPGASTNIDIAATGGSGVGYNYIWYENGTLIGNGPILNVTPSSSPTNYIGVAMDNCTTPSDSVSINVYWWDLPTPSFVRNKPDSCYPITIELTNTSAPASLIGSSSWYISDGSTINGNPINHLFDTPVCHDVTLTINTINGCVVDTTYPNFVCPRDYPNANFYMTPPITDVLNTEIEFTNLSTSLPLTYLWEFNSGILPDTSNETNPSYTFPDQAPGKYPVVLTVTNQYGCKDTARATVVINGAYLLYVPNSFSPDGDGINDIFRPYGEAIDFSKYNMQIFDRWGELIFETSEPELGWDGTYKGSNAQTQTYIWKIIAKEEYTPIIHDNIGHVNLIR